MDRAGHGPSLWEAARLWARIGCLSFGGAPAQIAMLHRAVVDERGWIDEATFLHALNFCMLLPGPEAQQLATYLGWRLNGVLGGIVAGALFVIPGAIVMLGLSLIYATLGHVPLIAAVFFGLKAAVLAVVIEAVIRISRRAFKTRWLVGIAVFSFSAIGLLGLPFPVIVLGTAFVAGLLGPVFPKALALPDAGASDAPRLTMSATSTGLTILVWLAVWFAPLALAALWLGADHRLVDIGVFFGRLAAVTFGGAYALLAWLAQAAVESKGWLTAPEMVDGLGLAETTPGPTILVTQFVGFIAAMRAPAPFSPLIAGVLGAALTVWMTFTPSYLWIFSFAPYLEALRRNRRLAAALTAITAIVVGVVAWVAFWFGLNVLFADVHFAPWGPIQIPKIGFSSVRWDACALALLAAWLLLVRHRRLAITLIATTLAGLVLRLALPMVLALN